MSLMLLQKNATYCSVDPFIIHDSNPVLDEELTYLIRYLLDRKVDASNNRKDLLERFYSYY